MGTAAAVEVDNESATSTTVEEDAIS